MESAFYKMKCQKGEDVQTFLTNLQFKCEELMAAGVSVTDRDYQCIMLQGIMRELAFFASALLSAHLLGSTSVNTETLIDHIGKEADHLRNHSGRLQTRALGPSHKPPEMKPLQLWGSRAGGGVTRANATIVGS